VRSVESLALAILRLLGEEARKERTAKVIAELPVDVATFLLNEKREWIQNIERSADVPLLLIANPNLETPNYTIRRVRDDQMELAENSGSSYTLTTQEADVLEQAVETTKKKTTETPAVTSVKPQSPAPAPTSAPATSSGTESPSSAMGLLGFIKKIFSVDDAAKVAAEAPTAKPKQPRSGAAGKKRTKASGGQRRTRSRRGGTSNRNRPAGDRQAANNRSTENEREQDKNTQQNTPDQNAQQGAKDGATKKPRRRRSRRSSAKKPAAADSRNSADSSDNSAANASGSERKGQEVAAAQSTPPAKPAGNKQPASTRTDVDGNKQSTDGNAAAQAPAAAKPPAPATPGVGNDQAAIRPTNNADQSAGNSAAAKPANETSSAPSKANERLLPWESPAAADKQKTYKVWSSGDPD